MKNAIFIDIDTDRDKPIMFSKPPEINPPKNKDEAREMILNDISCLANSLKALIIMAAENNYGDKKELVVACLNTINEALIQNKSDIIRERKKED